MKPFFRFVLFVLLLLGGVLLWQGWQDSSPRSLRDAWESLLAHRKTRHAHPEKYTVAQGPRVNLNDVDVLAALSRQRILLAQAVVPSVVSITTSRSDATPAFANDPLLQFFHRGLRPGSRSAMSLGSGAIVSREGHIVTNNHVVAQMDHIEVRLSDGRIKEATLIGADADTDIAVLKIDASNLLPLPFGDSDAVEVGETVMAVGDPYGLDESVTQGIISAKGRRDSEHTSDLFQTDAAINPGNSGGPLVNVRGELIAINEAIFSQSGGWQGVGFAIPASVVRTAMDSILKTGRVVHGYLGIQQLPAGPEALAQRGLSDQQGVLVDSVVAGSPAAKADIQPGDYIQRFNHEPVANFQDLRHGVAAVEVDTSVPIELLRGGKKISVNARIAERPPPEAQLSQFRSRALPPTVPAFPPAQPDRTDRGEIGGDEASLPGIRVTALSPSLSQAMSLPRDVRGVIIKAVDGASPLADKLQAGDVIEQINQQNVTSVADFASLVHAAPQNRPMVMLVVRDGARAYVVLGDG